MLRETWLLKKQLRVQSVATKCGYHVQRKRDSLVPTWMAGHALIYKAELHNAVTRPLGNCDSLFSYVKLIGNDDSHFYSLKPFF